MIFGSPSDGDCESPEGAVDPAEGDGPLEAAAEGRHHRRRFRARQDEEVGRDGGRVEQQVQQRVLPDQLQHAPAAGMYMQVALSTWQVALGFGKDHS